jgi:hypothetical protein
MVSWIDEVGAELEGLDGEPARGEPPQKHQCDRCLTDAAVGASDDKCPSGERSFHASRAHRSRRVFRQATSIWFARRIANDMNGVASLKNAEGALWVRDVTRGK